MERLCHSHAASPVLPAEGRSATRSGLKKRFMNNIKTGLKGITQQEAHRIGTGRRCTSPIRTSSCGRDKVTAQQGKTSTNNNQQPASCTFMLFQAIFFPDVLLKLLITKKKPKIMHPDQQTDKKHDFCCLTIITTDKWLSVTGAVVLR